MFNRKTRQIATLQGRLEKVLVQRDEAILDRDAAVRLNGRLADKADTAAETANRANRAWVRIVKDANRAESLFSRAMDARRAESARLRRTIADQKRQLAVERAATATERARANQLAGQVANMAADWQHSTKLKAAS